MSCLAYSVVPNGEGWSVRHKGHLAGHWRTRSEALHAVAALAREAYGIGNDVEVSVHDPEGRPHEVRRFDHED
jgi:hypothetical protein